MKTLKVLFIALAFLVAGSLQAQISINLHLGSQPEWGPAGYSNVDYYYLPDIEAYYDISSSMFIYVDNGVWVRRTYLPRRYRNYDLYNGYKVVINDYHGRDPYRHFDSHKRKYSKGYHGHDQKNIGERPGNRNYKASPQREHRSYRESNHRNDNNRQRENKNRGNDRGKKGHDRKKK